MKIFKKTIGIICAAAMLVSCFAMTMFVSAEDTNIALASNGATPISSGQRNGSQSEAKINDGTNDGFFGANMGNADAQGTVYFGVSFTENKSFDNIKIYWRDTNHAPAEGAYTIEYSTDGTNWTAATAQKVRTAMSAQDMTGVFGSSENQSRMACDTVTLSEKVTAVAVRVRVTVGELTQVQMYEFEVYGSAAAGTPDPDDDDDQTPDADTNVLKDNGTLYWDAEKISTYVGGLNENTLTDGNIDGTGANAWQPPKNGDKDIAVYIKLNDPVDLEKIVVYGEAANYVFDIQYTTETVTATDFAGMAAIEYTVLCDNTDVTGTAVTGGTEYVLEGFAKVEGVTALKLYTTSGNGGWLKYYEVEGYGAVATDDDDDQVPAEPVNVAPLGEPELTGTIDRGNVTLANLNDDDKATRTVSTAAPTDTEPVYAGIKWTESYDISKVVITWYAPTAIGEAKYKLQISTDGGATYTDVTATYTRETLVDTFTLASPVSGNAIRIVITAKAESATGNLSVCEFEAIGIPSFTDGDDSGDDDDDDEEVIPTTNIAPLGSAFEDSHRNSNDQSYINDKKMSEGKKWWQSQNVSDKDNADAFAGIKWRAPVSFKYLTIYWRDAGKWTTDDYVIQISTDGGKNWTTVDAVKTRENLGTQTYNGVECDRVFKDTIVLAEEAEANAVRIYLADGNKTVQMYELEIYGDAGNNANTGVESNALWIILFAAAALICVSSVVAPKLSRSK